MTVGVSSAPVIRLTLEGDVAAALRREARRRDMPAAVLAYSVLDAVLADRLVAAVLDDQAPPDLPAA